MAKGKGKGTRTRSTGSKGKGTTNGRPSTRPPTKRRGK